MKLLFAIVLVLFAASSAVAEPVCVFLGDSLTLGVRTTPERVTEQQRFSYLVAKRNKCREVNAGVGADTTEGMLARFDNDVAPHKPRVVYVMTENDYWPGRGFVEFERSEANLRAIIARGKAIGAEVVIVTSPPVAMIPCGPPISRDSCRKLASQRYLEPSYVEMQRRVAKEAGAKLIDVHKARWNTSHFQDPWNLNAKGHRLVADTIK